MAARLTEADLRQRIATVVVPSSTRLYAGSPCLEWSGRLNRDGYGITYDPRRGHTRVVHRIAWELNNGLVPEGRELDHLCRNRACASLLHLEPVPHVENVRRGDAGGHLKRRTHCPRGHSYEGANLRRLPDGSRECKTCRIDRKRVARAGGPGLGHNALKTRCPAGHPYNEANTLVDGGARRCRICRTAQLAARTERRRLRNLAAQGRPR